MDLRVGTLATCALVWSLGCAVGDAGSGFTGPANTFGGGGNSDSANTGGMQDTDGDTDTDGVATFGGADGDTEGNEGPGPGCVPTDELCDGMDNDCDGVADNGNPESGAPCTADTAGECNAGVTSCENGAVVCIATGMPTAEVCDGLDNDCNGTADDNPGDVGGACNTGMPGVCSDGVSQCSGGAIQCVANNSPSSESCDGVDNDCDGSVDNGNPGGGGACGTGQPGICAAGTNQCQGGSLTCQQNQGPVAEICGNGLDDDCDGSVDDGCNTCTHDICLTGAALVNGCDPCVTQICAVDPFCCTTSWDSLCVSEVGSVCGLVC